jgi:uracil-DNA glycosylase family protein
MELLKKLEILADAAKYDASCSSSGTTRRSSVGGRGMGSSEGSGICHAYAPDGRCISLLKILLTNFCIYECSYCINRNSSNVQRARFTTKEVVDLTLDFYKRNYIEGLFLSSGVIQSPDYTMAQLVEVARSLRVDHDFRGYIHLKTIPDAGGQLLADAGRFADRLSINIELPTQVALADLAPEKDHRTIKLSMARIRAGRDEVAEQRRQAKRITNASPRRAAAPRFAPAGQSTQMIIGAEPSTDALEQLSLRAAMCCGCPLYGPATQTVFGEGPQKARLMLVGEQPGDAEDLAGRPFVGPAGQLLDRALNAAGLDRSQLYLTNAVKHFKFEPRGKQRLHAKLDYHEVAACRPWLDAEIMRVAPDVVMALGGTAASALLERRVAVTRERGRAIAWKGRQLWVTVHPSFLLRSDATAGQSFDRFVADLRIAAAI